MRRPALPWVLAAVAALAAPVLCHSILPPAARAGDATVARTLFDSAKKAFNGRRYDEAVILYRKAFDEDPTLIEAVYWIGLSQDRRKDDAAALAAYREFLNLCDAAGSGLDGEPKKLRATAEKRVDALAVGEKEFRKLEDRAVADLLDFANAHFVRDPAIAREAVERILAWRPDDGTAQALFEKLGGAPRNRPAAGDAGATGPFATVKVWRDLLADHAIKTDAITYEGDVMVLDTKGGSKITPSRPIPLGGVYCYEVDLRIAEAYEGAWLTGLTFGETKSGFYSAFLQKAQVVLIDAAEGRGNRELAVKPLPLIETGSWHRLGVVVRGTSVEVWLDGKAVIDERIKDREDLKGDIGVFQQGCRTERRVFRAGDL